MLRHKNILISKENSDLNFPWSVSEKSADAD